MFVKRRPFLYCLALLILAAEPIQSQQRAEDKPLVLKGATIIDGLGNSPISEGLIVIEQDRIKTVGRKGSAYPSDANVVDVSGKFIIPGLVDSHVHYQPWLGEMFLNYGVTSVMIPGGDYSTADRSLVPDERPNAPDLCDRRQAGHSAGLEPRPGPRGRSRLVQE